MEWHVLSKYLDDVTAKIGTDRSKVRLLVGSVGNGREMTESNCDHGYDKPECYSSTGARFSVMDGGQFVTEFYLCQFPGCCAFCISTGVYVVDKLRGKGINTLTNKLRQHIAEAAGYTALICTDAIKNIPERKTLAKNGWLDVYTCNNRRTGNDVAISIKGL